MKTALFLALVPALLMFAGCGGGSPKVRTESPEVEFAKDTREAIADLQSAVKKDLRAAKQEIDIIVENFEGYEKEPIGQNKAAYDAIAAGLRELKDLLSKSAPKRQILAKADELASLAAKLPGAAEPAK